MDALPHVRLRTAGKTASPHVPDQTTREVAVRSQGRLHNTTLEEMCAILETNERSKSKSAQSWSLAQQLTDDKIDLFQQNNILWGVTIGHQEDMDKFAPTMKELKRIKPNMRLVVSYEPAHGFVDWSPLAGLIDWLIAGGESEQEPNKPLVEYYRSGALPHVSGATRITWPSTTSRWAPSGPGNITARRAKATSWPNGRKTCKYTNSLLSRLIHDHTNQTQCFATIRRQIRPQ